MLRRAPSRALTRDPPLQRQEKTTDLKVGHYKSKTKASSSKMVGIRRIGEMMKLLFRLMKLGGAMAFAAICGVAQDSGDKRWKAQWITAAGVAETDNVGGEFQEGGGFA